MALQMIDNSLRVVQSFDGETEPYIVDVEDEKEACLVYQTLRDNYKFMRDKGIVNPIYFSVNVEMRVNDYWLDYFNEKEDMSWDEFYENYFY